MKSARCYFLFTIFLLTSVALSAQQIRTTFRGIVIDETEQTIPGVTIMVLSAADSILVQYATSDAEGNFILPGVPTGQHLLNLSFLGMQPVFKPITSGTSKEVDLGKLKMVSSSTMLSEVEVKADFIPIEIKKDTITYNADAFQTTPDAVVEDLLKKMPGIEVQSDGSIKAQGEDVDKVLVDGKEFFGNDPKAATKNLPARSVKKVKVYDKKSDIAEFTGVDDGEREKTIDLQLREEFKKGLFGKAEAGYGNEDRYNAKASFNKFSKTVQLSFLGQYNNINQQGFSYNEQSSFTGRGFSGDIPRDGVGTGLINTAAGGINFNWQKSKQFNLRTSYFYNNVENTLLQTSLRENLSDIPYDTEENSDKSNSNLTHRFNLNSEIKPDSMQEINLNGRFSLGKSSALNESLLENFIPGASIESRSITNTEKENDNLNINTSGTYVRRFGNKGQNIATTFTYSQDDADNASTLDALTTYFNTGSTEELDQLQYSISDNMSWSGQFALTQPLNKRRFLELNYFYNQTEADYNKDVLDVYENGTVPNDELSNAFSSILKIHRPSMTFRYSGENKNVNVALQYQITELTGHDDETSGDIIKQYKHFLPRVIYRNDIGNGKHMRISYTTRISPPSITQLSPSIDNTDPLRLYTGNPDLNTEYIHYANINFHAFSQFTSTSFFVGLNGSLTDDKIITSKSIDAQLIEISKPVNIDHEWYGSIYSSFGRPLKPIHTRFNLNASANYTNTQSKINNDILDLDRLSKSIGVSFNNMNSQVLEYNFGGQWTFTDNLYKLNEDLNQNTVLHNYFADASLTVWKKWKISGSYNYNLYTSSSFPDQALPLMKASLSRYILPKDKGQIILSVFDVLDENRGLSRTSQVNYIEEIRSNSIGRYAMLSFVYNVRGKGQEAPGAIRMRPH